MTNTINIEDIKLTDAERQPCEIWTRVMGYHRPVSEFNKGKKSEYDLLVLDTDTEIITNHHFCFEKDYYEESVSDSVTLLRT